MNQDSAALWSKDGGKRQKLQAETAKLALASAALEAEALPRLDKLRLEVLELSRPHWQRPATMVPLVILSAGSVRGWYCGYFDVKKNEVAMQMLNHEKEKVIDQKALTKAEAAAWAAAGVQALKERERGEAAAEREQAIKDASMSAPSAVQLAAVVSAAYTQLDRTQDRITQLRRRLAELARTELLTRLTNGCDVIAGWPDNSIVAGHHFEPSGNPGPVHERRRRRRVASPGEADLRHGSPLFGRSLKPGADLCLGRGNVNRTRYYAGQLRHS